MSSVKSTASSTRRKSKGRTFQCTGYPDCNMIFTRSEHLARHIRKHTGERPFECVHCARKFSRLDNLRQHKQTVHAHEQMFINYGKPLPALPHEAQEQNKENETSQQETIAQTNEDGELPQGSTDLLKPTQFRSKHRPSPLALPRGPVYNDAPYTAPTPRSSNSQHFALSPVSPGHQSQHSALGNLPPFQFLTTQSVRDSTYSDQSSVRDSTYSNPRDSLYSNPRDSTYSNPSRDSTYSNHSLLRDPSYLNPSINSNQSNYGSLISPYNSSFTSYSNSDTPANSSSFDSVLKTPTSTQYPINSTVQNGGNNVQNTGSRKSWLNNVLNSNSSNGSNNSSESIPEHQQSPPMNSNGGNRLRIESLLNNSDRNKRLPPVENLGIETADRI